MPLCLDDILHRQVAMLLRPELLSDEPADLERIRERDGSSSFDELIDYIRANLDQPLQLSDLEARSHYSRRALQYAFRQRLDCTPKQFIRQQRLDWAMAQLRQQGRNLTVRQVLLACGYHHAGHFTRDFHARFGLLPSQVRRDAPAGEPGRDGTKPASPAEIRTADKPSDQDPSPAPPQADPSA